MKTDHIAWAGGNMPVDADTVVYPTYRDGSASKARRAGDLRWEHIGQVDDITAYSLTPVPVETAIMPPSRTNEQFAADRAAGINPVGLVIDRGSAS